MQNSNLNSITRTWPWTGILLILVAIGPRILGIQLQTPTQLFVYGVILGMVIVYFMAFIFQAGKEFLEKRS